jgi:hypothetical protein
MGMIAEIETITKENALEKLKEVVRVRDRMGGSLYWNVLNEEACQVANKCFTFGYKKAEIEVILGEGNFC